MSLSIQSQRHLQRLKNLLAFLSLDCNSELNFNSLSEFSRTAKDKPHSSSSTVNGKRSTAPMSVLPQADTHTHTSCYGIMYTQWFGWHAYTSPYWRWHQAVFLSLPWVRGSRVHVNNAEHTTWQVSPQRQWRSRRDLPPKEEGLALLPGSQIPQRFSDNMHQKCSCYILPEMAVLRLMVLCRSCTSLVRAVRACSPATAYFLLPTWQTNNCSVERQASPFPNHHGTMTLLAGQLHCLQILWSSYKQARHKISYWYPKEETERSLSYGESQAGCPSRIGMGNTLGKSIWTLLVIQQVSSVEGRHHLDNRAGRSSQVSFLPSLSHAPPLQDPGTLSLSPRKTACYFLPLPHSQGF